jgi:hypothetical protein
MNELVFCEPAMAKRNALSRACGRVASFHREMASQFGNTNEIDSRRKCGGIKCFHVGTLQS